MNQPYEMYLEGRVATLEAETTEQKQLIKELVEKLTISLGKNINCEEKYRITLISENEKIRIDELLTKAKAHV